jgi:ABC-type branched-subunit amino acid transport system ATPase component
MLRVKNLDGGYGVVQVLWRITLEVKQGEITALIGSNGMGKTTLMRTIAGNIKPIGGQLFYKGQDITHQPQTLRVKDGISMIPEGRQLYFGMTVADNLLMGAYTRKDKEGTRNDLEWVYSIFPTLKERGDQLAGTLSGGESQMCAIGRGLMSDPKLLLVDELSLGLAPVVVDSLVRILTKIHQEKNLTILLVDQDVQTALDISRRAYVIENGRVVIERESGLLKNDPEIKKAYLGM